MKKTIIVFVLLSMILVILSGCSGINSNLKIATDTVKGNLIQDLSDLNITDYTIAEEAIYDSYYSDYRLDVEIPSLSNLNDEELVEILYTLCEDGEGFYLSNQKRDSDFTMLAVDIIINGNRYHAYDDDSYYMNGNEVIVHEKNYSSSKSGNYDPNDSYYSSNDSNNDGYINQEEFQNAVGNWMDDHGY